MPRKPGALPLRIYLFQQHVGEDEVWDSEKNASRSHVAELGVESDNLGVAAQSIGEPKWVKWLRPHAGTELDDLYSAIASAALIVKTSERLFAITFGHGRHLLNLDAVEFDFGLKAVLNSVEPTQLRSVDARTIDENALQTRRSAGRDSALRSFGLDITQDLIRGVSGTPRGSGRVTKMAGADVLAVNAKIDPKDLVSEIPGLCDEMLVAYGLEVYRESFEFIDYLRPEKSTARIAELDHLLVDRLNSGDRDDLTDVHLAAPEIVDPVALAGYRYQPSGRRGLDIDPRITTYLSIRAGEALTVDTLKSDYLVAWSATSDSQLDRWSIYRSVVFEVEHDDKLYALSGGRWFRVDRDYRDRVYQSLNDIVSRTDLPEGQAVWSEDEYNRHAAASLGAACMDKQFVLDDGPDKMEVCDILTPDGALLHVKKRGSSSTVSHLFNQAVNSAERLMRDKEFRKQARGRARALGAEFSEVVPLGKPSASEFEIGLVILTRSERETPFTLPFFSVVSLKQAVERLDALGFNVTVTAVQEA